MANTYKNIIISPQRSSDAADPTIEFRGGNSTVNTVLTLYNLPTSNGKLVINASAGDLLTITNDLSGDLLTVANTSANLLNINSTSATFNPSVTVTVGNATYNTAIASGTVTLTANGTGDAATPSGNNVRLFADYSAGRTHLATKEGSGWETYMHPHMGHTIVSWVLPNPNATTVSAVRAVAANALAYVARAPAAGNTFLSAIRIGQTTAATNTSIAVSRTNALTWHRGNTANTGGFYAVARFGISVNVGNSSCFVGFKDSTTALAGAFDAQTNIIGVGWGQGKSNVFAMSANASVANTIDLGAGFPANAAGNSVWFEVALYARPAGGTVSYQLTNLTTGNTVVGDFNQTNLPSNSTFLTWQFAINNGLSSAACSADWGGVVIESPY